MKKEEITLPKQLLSLPEIHSVCTRLCLQFGFDHFLYISKPDKSTNSGLCIIHGSSDTKKAIHSQGILRITRSSEPSVSDFDHLTNIFPVEFRHEAMNFLLNSPQPLPLRSCLSFPVKHKHESIAILVLGSSIDDYQPQLSNTQLSRAREFVLGIHQAATTIIGTNKSKQTIKLTDRERECLEWAAVGKTNWEIGTIIGVTKRTVIFHLQNAAGKLQTKNRYHTVAIAIANNLIKGN